MSSIQNWNKVTLTDG